MSNPTFGFLIIIIIIITKIYYVHSVINKTLKP